MSRVKKLALSGLLCALSALVMLMGGLIPLATFVCPAVSALLLIPVFVECGEKLAWAAWAAVALLSLIICPDKEAALLMVFIGYYPILKWRLEQIRKASLRYLAKLGIFNLAVVSMYALGMLLFRLDWMLRDYQELGLILSIACLLVGNITLIIYDRLAGIFVNLYVQRWRKRLL